MTYRAMLATGLALALFTLSLPAASAAAGSDNDRLERIAREGVNTLRAQNGLRPLRRSRALSRSASGYANFMLARHYFGHLGSIRAPGHFRSLGEVLLMHRGRHGRPRLAVRHWARSAGHRFVLLSRRYRRIGVGMASGHLYGRRVIVWVAHVGRR